MQWGSWGDFLHMGGYGLYVWGSYGVTLLAMVAEAVAHGAPAPGARRGGRMASFDGGGARRRAALTGSPESVHLETPPAPVDAGRAAGAGCLARSLRSSSTPSTATSCSSTRPRRWRRNEAPAGAHVPLGRAGRSRAASSVTALKVQLRRHRFGEDRAGALCEGVLPDLFKEGKGVVAQGQAGQRWRLRRRARCWPSTTRTTCRPKPPRRCSGPGR
jgi:heme exporter protein D